MINKSAFDNHVSPQYLFLIDENKIINNNIIILKTENLNDSMKELGYDDFNEHALNSKIDKSNIKNFLNNMSINLINEFYNLDFKYFNYEKIKVNFITLHNEIACYNNTEVKNKIKEKRNINI